MTRDDRPQVLGVLDRPIVVPGEEVVPREVRLHDEVLRIDRERRETRLLRLLDSSERKQEVRVPVLRPE